MNDPERNGKKPTPSDEFAFEPQTELGRKLWEIRQRAVASGMKLLSWEELEREIADRCASRLVGRDDSDVP